jgi:ABC-2 type transport system ATP-binding protein
MSALLRAENLTVRHQQRVVLGPLSLTLQRGEKVALIGGNGSGKSTLLRCLAGVQKPWRGQLEQGAQQLSYMPDLAPTESGLTVRELLLEWAVMRDTPITVVDALLQQLDLVSVSTRACAQLSLGFRQRIALAMCLLPVSELLLLDEPSNGLDPQQQLLLQHLLRQRSESVVVVTHHIAAWQSFCTRVLALQHGELIFDGSMADYLSRTNKPDQSSSVNA